MIHYGRFGDSRPENQVQKTSGIQLSAIQILFVLFLATLFRPLIS